MDKDFNILKGLATYKPSPPEIAFEAIKEGFVLQKNIEFTTSLQNLTDFKLTPPSFLYQEVLEKISDRKFETNSGLLNLKEFTSVPPTYLLENILKQTQLNNKKNVFLRIININGNGKFILQIAAGLLLCLLASLVYFVSVNISFDIVQISDDENAPIVHAAVTNNALKIIPSKLKSESKIIPLHLIKKNKKLAPPKPIITDGTELLKETSLTVNGVSMPFVDNDFFATFTSFNFVTTDFLNNIPEGKDVTVKLNNFSAISISAKMQGMMKKMYKIKRNGKIPNSAKKVQKKLMEWKVDDNNAFDLDFKKNPVDELDLFDFLLDHK